MAIQTTQRAYTLRLRGGDPNDKSWSDNLWKTHEAVNKGAKVFGDWLLTLRGGLDHSLADSKEKRIILALSWLSVESEKGAPSQYTVRKDAKTGKWQTVEALNEILKARGVRDAEIKQWTADCEASLSAAIREDAVWVNRSKAFDDMCNGQDKSNARKDAQTLLWHLFSKDYLVLPREKQKSKKEASDIQKEPNEEVQEQKQSAVIQSGKGAGQKTRHLFSYILGFKDDSEGFGKGKQKLELKDWWKKYLTPLIRTSGIPLDSKKTKKRSEGHAPTELHREMFSKAAARLAQIHTKQKQQEVEREHRKKADEELKKLEEKETYNEALKKLKDYCEQYGFESGALGDYTIHPRQIDKWDRVVGVWAEIKETDPDRVKELRTEEAKRLQDEYRDEKFGDINLFIRLAEKDYKPVWWHNNQADSSILTTFVKGEKARADAQRLKVAAYRHPDPYFNPVFCQFGVSRPVIEFQRLKEEDDMDIRAVKMLLWDGNKAVRFDLIASGKRFDEEFGSRQEMAKRGDNSPQVTRRSRLFMATVSASKENVRVANVFDKKETKPRKEGKGTEEKDTQWNGTLQADRRKLKRAGELVESNNSTKSKSLLEKMKWWLTVSMELQPQGPWFEYIDKANDKSPFERTYKSGEKKGQPYISLTGWLYEKVNEKRQGYARLFLSRLPGLRVLSVDLGHRYAAACAVWETIDSRQIEEDCKSTGIKPPSSDALYLHLKEKNHVGKDKTIIYRRIGSDRLPDSDKEHPTPWARLDRQFLIKLQGEEEEARKASPAEIGAVEKLEAELGIASPDKRSLQVDELMSEAVRTVRLALRRHADMARIAHYLITDQKTLPGGRAKKLDEPSRVELLTDALERWYGLGASKRWRDERATELWNKQSWKDSVPLVVQEDEEKTRQQIKKEKAELRRRLTPVAEELARNGSLRMKLHARWATNWREEDDKLQKHLRWLRDWILPRGKKAKNPSIRNVGGLSLTRLATIRSLYQVQKAFYAKLEPDGSHETAGEGFGKSILDALENMRETRVKQLASRIVEAALGVGRIKIPKKGKDPERPTMQVDAPCHAVVIEDLTNYRPEETRTRRENRQLMTWSAGKVKKYLFEACQLHGLHLQEVRAGYTSRQDSRTGAPGIRCADIPVKKFLESPLWKREFKRAKEKIDKNKGDARDRYICDLHKKWSGKTDAKVALRIPLRGGEIFVSADISSPASKGIQADLNAASNIGLQALLDPDWPGRWWYVPCDTKEYKPVKDKVAGSAAIGPDKALKEHAKGDNSEDPNGKGKKKGKTKEIVNLWRNVSTSLLTNGQWDESTAYWNKVQHIAVQNLRGHAELDS